MVEEVSFSCELRAINDLAYMVMLLTTRRHAGVVSPTKAECRRVD